MDDPMGDADMEAALRAGLADLVASGPDPRSRHHAIDARIADHQAGVAGRRRFLVGAAATAAAGAGAVWLVRGDGGSTEGVTSGPAGSGARPTAGAGPTGPPTEAPAGWRAIPAAPLSARRNPHAVWAGDRLLVWGGVASSGPDLLPPDGASWHPGATSWKEMASAPAGGMDGGFALWTGTELLVGPTEVDDAAPWNDGATAAEARPGIAAYDPSSNRWRYIGPIGPAGGPAPLTSARQAVLIGDGSMLVAVRAATPTGGPAGRDLVRVDLRSGAVEVLAPGPFATSPYRDRSGTVALAVVGSVVVATPNWDLRPWVLDVGAGSWARVSPPSGADSLHLLPGTPIGEAVLFAESDGPTKYWAFDPHATGDGAWRAVPSNPHQLAAWRYEPVWNGSEYFIPGAAYDPGADRWRAVEPPPRGPNRQRSLQALWAGDALVLFGGEEYDCPDAGLCDRSVGPDALDGWINVRP